MTAQPSSGQHAHGDARRAKPRRRILSRNRACQSKRGALWGLREGACYRHHFSCCCPRRQAHRKHLHPRTRCCISSRQSTAPSVRGAFDVRFGLKNMGVTHAGDPYPNSGHHHLLIDVDQPLDVKEPIPRDKNHLHFGAGETETRIELPPGDHTLQLVLGDAKHYPFNPPVVSDKISITVLSERTHAKRTEKARNREKEREGEKQKGGHRRRRRHQSSQYQQPYQQQWQQPFRQPYQHRSRGHGNLT